ncbi:MAG TPA: hypothetical protein PLU64_18090, partial [Saprospiraceae bacterium]|nr:hypothetical protein [Saprospiraceae bacterium]
MGEAVRLGCAPEVDTLCYRWAPSLGLDEPNATRPWATPDETTAYRVYVTDFHGNLIGEDEVEVIVDGQFQVRISPDTAFVCEGQFVVLTVQDTFPTYHWQDGSSGSSFSTASPGAYGVTVTDDKGCTGSGQAVVALSGEQLSITPSPAVLCMDTITLQASEGFAWYRWVDAEGENIGYEQSLSVEDTGLYYVYAVADNGCSLVDSVTVRPSIESLNISPLHPVLCQDGETVLAAPTGFDSYEWYDAAGAFLGNAPSITVNATGEYSVVIFSEDGCHQRLSVEVEESLVVDAEILPADPAICYMDTPGLQQGPTGRAPGSLCQPDVTLSLNHPYQYYEWSTGEMAPSILVTEPGAYRVTVTGYDGCNYDTVVEVKPCISAPFEMSPYPLHL